MRAPLPPICPQRFSERPGSTATRQRPTVRGRHDDAGPMNTLEPAVHACDKDGLLLRRDAVAMGIDDKALARLVRAKFLVRLRQGIYCDRSVFIAADERERHRLLCAGVIHLYDSHVALSHASACIVQGGPAYGLDLRAVHLTHLKGGGRQRSRIRHHTGECRVGDLRRLDGHWVTTPARSVADTVCTDGVVAGLVQANHFLHCRLMVKDELAETIARSSNWPGSLRQHPVLLLADERIESVGESRTSHLVFSQGLPMPEPQFEIFDPFSGTTYRVDFAWPEHRVIVEFDGKEKYHRYRRPGETIEQAVMREKAREDRIRELTGWTVIRITWRDLSFPEHTAQRIRAALNWGSLGTLGRAAGL